MANIWSQWLFQPLVINNNMCNIQIRIHGLFFRIENCIRTIHPVDPNTQIVLFTALHMAFHCLEYKFKLYSE